MWSNQFGGSTAGDSAYVNGVASDSSGNLFVAGRYRGAVNFAGGALSSSAGSDDVFVAKYSAGGSYQWAQGFGSTGSDSAAGVAVDGSGNVVVAGSFQGTVNFGGGPLTATASNSMFVAKYSPTGGYLWAKALAGPVPYAVAVDGSGNVVVTGYYYGTVDFGGGAISSINGSTDIFVAKYSPNGSYLWAKSYGGTNTDMARAVAVDGNGNVVVAGYFWGTANFGGGSLTSFGSNDIFVAKYASDGSYVWAKQFGGTGADYAYGVAVDGAGNVLVAGTFANTVDFGGGALTASTSGGDIFLAKYTPSGGYLWAKHFGGTSAFGSVAYAVGVDSNGNPLLTGWINDFVNFGGGPLTAPLNSYDIFVAKFNSAGDYQWAKRAGAEGSDYGNSVAADSGGNVLVAGYFTTSADFGCGTLSSAGGVDGYAVKLSP